MHNKTLTISLFSRFLIILQLCFGFSMALYFLGYPFSAKLFKSKSDLLLIESILGQNHTLFSIDPEKAAALQSKAAIRQALFEALPPEKREEIQNKHLEIEQSLQQSMLEKSTLLLKTPKLQLLWVFLAILLPILLLLRNKNALPYLWLFPLISLGFAWNNQNYGYDPLLLSEKILFPKEDQLLATTSSHSREDWEQAWNHYLITHFAKESPSENKDIFNAQAVKGEFFFNLARIDYIEGDLSGSFWEKRSLITLFIYFAWDLFFAYTVFKCRV